MKWYDFLDYCEAEKHMLHMFGLWLKYDCLVQRSHIALEFYYMWE
jgi:hypothetical protein